MKENAGLNSITEEATNLYEIKKKEISQKESTCQLLMTIIFIIIILAILIFFLFSDFSSEGKENKISNNLQEKDQKTEKNKHILKEEKEDKNDQEEKKCKEGYYMPTDGKKCRKCFIENCSKCSGTKKNNICSICMEPYNPIYDKKKIKKL